MAGEPAVRERPLIMSGPLVVKTLAGKKWQTRRVITPQPTGVMACANVPGGWSHAYGEDHEGTAPRCHCRPLRCRYGQPGEKLWIRETFLESDEYDHEADRFVVYYRATDAGQIEPDASRGFHWQPSIFLPRRLCRLVLTLVEVGVERLQAITPEGALAEGFASVPAFAAYWDQLNAVRGFTWASDPWVWRLEWEPLPVEGAGV